MDIETRLQSILADCARRGEQVTVKRGRVWIHIQSSNGNTGKLNVRTGHCSWNLHTRFNSFNPATRR